MVFCCFLCNKNTKNHVFFNDISLFHNVEGRVSHVCEVSESSEYIIRNPFFMILGSSSPSQSQAHGRRWKKILGSGSLPHAPSTLTGSFNNDCNIITEHEHVRWRRII